MDQSAGGAAARQREIYVHGAAGRRSPVPVDVEELELAARDVMTPEAFAYIAGGAGRERTMEANLAGFDAWQIVPRMLRDVGTRSLQTEFLGQTLASPLLLSPIGVLEMAHPEADLAVGRAAAACDVPYIFSNQASEPMEAVAEAMGDARRYFQLYWSKSNELVESVVCRAEAGGCEAIFVTLDTTLLGWRTRDLGLAYLPFLRGKGIAQYTSDPVFERLMQQDTEGDAPRAPISVKALATLVESAMSYPGSTLSALGSGNALKAVRTFVDIYSRPTLTWDDLDFLRQCTDLPILLKGIQHPDDARRAVDAGVQGIMVSNHGGRQVDGAIGSIEALPAIAEAVGGQIDIAFDSGIRGGADMLKALALGADVVGVGRPYCYGLAIAGESGVRDVLGNLLADFELTMALSGVSEVSQISRDLLEL